MSRSLRQPTATLLAGGGVAAALAAIALFDVFPGARFIGLLLVILAGVLFWASRVFDKPAHERKLWLRTPLDLPILLLLVQIGVSFWASVFPEKSWTAVGQLVAGFVAYYAIVNWSTDPARLWWSVAALIALGIGLTAVAPFAVDWFRERKTFLPPSLYQYFPLLLSDSIHPNVMAGSLVTLLPLPLALSLALSAANKRDRRLRVVLFVICLGEIAVVILTKSRGGYIALGVGLWLTLWLSNRRRLALALVLVVVIVAVLVVSRPTVTVSPDLDPAQAALDASTWAFRQRVWQAALQLIGDFPFTGGGIGTFNDVALLLYGFSSPQNPGAHNLFLQAAVDLGALGLVSFLAILLLVLWAAFQTYRRLDQPQGDSQRAIAVGGLSGIAATIAHGLVDSHTWGSKGAFIPWAVMGLVVALYSLTLLQPCETESQESTRS
jgi:hypothetical protein